MVEERNWKRIRERLALHLPVRIQGRDTPQFVWNETTRLNDVTPFGAGFTLKRPTEKGRLLHLTIPMPRQLRVFDHLEDQYKMWAIVRYMRTDIYKQQTVFHIGVAFIGKRPPASYETEPWRRYEVATSSFDALAAGKEILTPIREQRTEDRYNIAVDMRLDIVDESGNIIESEQSVTENISTKGATVFTTLQISAGRFIRVTSEQYGITAHAAVRDRSTGADGVARLHVEFIDKEWPL